MRDYPIPSPKTDAHRVGRRPITRFEALSDAVFAIALTLLVIDIGVPDLEVEGLTAVSLLHALGDLWPNYLGYALSFTLVGLIWTNHHNATGYFIRTTHTLNVLNLAFLFWIALAPFPAALLSRFIGTDARNAVVLVYGAWNLVTSISFQALWEVGRRNPDVLWADSDPVIVQGISLTFLIGTIGFIVAVALAWWFPLVSIALIVVLEVIFLTPLPNRIVDVLQARRRQAT